MIEIIDKHNCCGCSACVQACPKQCISFDEDDQGFRYPLVNKKLCIDCHLCEKVCPCLNQNEPRKPLIAYAAINPNDDIRMESSSGGIFTMLAEVVIDEGGVVIGVRFDESWEAIHDYTEKKEGLSVFRGSKYVQSRVGYSYIKVREFLKEGRKVIFSGTSCQIAGLNHFLCKEYDNLLTVEVVCHGVPSPKIWRKYISSLSPSLNFTYISMKDKSDSWRGYKIRIKGEIDFVNEKASKNMYMLAFAQNLSLRPSCFNCPAKAGKSYSDIILADYWGIEHVVPKMDDDKGTSFVCINTVNGAKMFDKVITKRTESSYEASVKYNSCFFESTKEPIGRKDFFASFSKVGITILSSLQPIRRSLLVRITDRIKKITG